MSGIVGRKLEPVAPFDREEGGREAAKAGYNLLSFTRKDLLELGRS